MGTDAGKLEGTVELDQTWAFVAGRTPVPGLGAGLPLGGTAARGRPWHRAAVDRGAPSAVPRLPSAVLILARWSRSRVSPAAQATGDGPYGGTTTTTDRGPQPSCQLQAESAPPGGTVDRAAQGRARGSRVEIRFDGEVVAEATATGPGASPRVNIDISFVVPADAAPGDHQVTAVGSRLHGVVRNARTRRGCRGARVRAGERVGWLPPEDRRVRRSAPRHRAGAGARGPRARSLASRRRVPDVHGRRLASPASAPQAAERRRSGTGRGAGIPAWQTGPVPAAEELDDPSSDDSPKEACGVFGVYAPGQPVAHLTYLGLFALQHRGQESAGHGGQRRRPRSSSSRTRASSPSVFDDRTLAGLTGHLAIGHCRYSTTGSSTWRNAQPAYRRPATGTSPSATTATSPTPRRWPPRPGCCPGTVTSDTDLIAELIGNRARAPARGRSATTTTSSERSCAVLPAPRGRLLARAHGRARASSACATRTASARCASASSRTAAGCSRRRARPSTSSAPTSCASSIPGEMVVIDAAGPRSLKPFPDERIDPKLCLFEFVYFARPDSRLYGQSVHQARIRMGEQLAEQAPVEADMVMGVPESGRPRRRGLRPAQRHPVRPGRGEEPLHRPQLHRPEPGAAGPGRAHEAQPAAREHRRQAPRRRRRLDRARHHAEAAHQDAARGRRRARSTCASRRRR